MANWDGLERELRAACPGLELRREEPMSKHTSFRIGGPAALMALPKLDVEVDVAIETAGRLGIKPFFLGNGSNLLVSDGGYDGFVIKLSGCYSEVWSVNKKEGLIVAGGGASLSSLSKAALDAGLAGLEFAFGIPGSVGGAITMNAGAYGGEVAQVLERVTVMDADGAADAIAGKDCDLSYRHSAFEDGRRIILDAVFRLKPGDPEAIQARMAEFSEQRRSKQPLEYPSAGSTFKRPPAVDGQPVYAAALIDRCGLKGLTVGDAQVSEKHAGFVVNRGGATCADVLELVGQVKERVLAQTGVALELEVKTLGV